MVQAPPEQAEVKYQPFATPSPSFNYPDADARVPQLIRIWSSRWHSLWFSAISGSTFPHVSFSFSVSSSGTNHGLQNLELMKACARRSAFFPSLSLNYLLKLPKAVFWKDEFALSSYPRWGIRAESDTLKQARSVPIMPWKHNCTVRPKFGYNV